MLKLRTITLVLLQIVPISSMVMFDSSSVVLLNLGRASTPLKAHLAARISNMESHRRRDRSPNTAAGMRMKALE
jgi:hypothetical protein